MTQPEIQAPQANPGDLTSDLKNARATHLGMLLSIVSLMLICFLWETWLAPLRPGGTWLAVKAAPLILPLMAVRQRNLYRLQLSSILIWLYFTEGVVRGFSDLNRLSSWLGWCEALAALSFFLCAIFYIQPYKKAAKLAAKLAATESK